MIPNWAISNFLICLKQNFHFCTQSSLFVAMISMFIVFAMLLVDLLNASSSFLVKHSNPLYPAPSFTPTVFRESNKNPLLNFRPPSPPDQSTRIFALFHCLGGYFDKCDETRASVQSSAFNPKRSKPIMTPPGKKKKAMKLFESTATNISTDMADAEDLYDKTVNAHSKNKNQETKMSSSGKKRAKGSLERELAQRKERNDEDERDDFETTVFTDQDMSSFDDDQLPLPTGQVPLDLLHKLHQSDDPYQAFIESSTKIEDHDDELIFPLPVPLMIKEDQQLSKNKSKPPLQSMESKRTIKAKGIERRMSTEDLSEQVREIHPSTKENLVEMVLQTKDKLESTPDDKETFSNMPLSPPSRIPMPLKKRQPSGKTSSGLAIPNSISQEREAYYKEPSPLASSLHSNSYASNQIEFEDEDDEALWDKIMQSPTDYTNRNSSYT